ncbi:MAG: AIR synthase-related protein, partial [Actinomycetota bacterium]|nr:AIR synthase-related protein [Actinomycetota bacterium]
DVVSASRVVLSVTVLGSLEGRDPVTRAGARPGDVLALVGRVGWAAAGLAVLMAGGPNHPAAPLEVVDAHRVPDPPYAAGPAAALAGATAMIDISDGLLADVGHLASASGVAVDVHSAALAVPDALAETAAALHADPVRWLLTGGEDHALVATFPAGAALPPGWSPIGVVRAGSGVSVDGQVYDGASGWDHFGRLPS